MPKLYSFILLLLMCVAFTAEVVVAHNGISTVAFAREEEKEKETEEKKSKEDKLKNFTSCWTATPLPGNHRTSSSSENSQLSAGYHTMPFNPPDVI